jgi:hypothetical protein
VNVERALRTKSIEVLWLDKALNVAPDTIRLARHLGAKVIEYTPDDCRIRNNVSADMLAGIPECDVFVTSKRHNIEWLQTRGARRVVWSYQGFDEDDHQPPRPVDLDPGLRERVVFVGAFEAERARTIESLLRAGLPVTVISAWKQWRQLTSYPQFSFRCGHVFGTAYATAHASSAVSLGFLRKSAQDEHTTRTFEIPACGGVMLTERTVEQTQVFREGEEAEFFSNDDECIARCRVLLADAQRREFIRQAGRHRCLGSGYSWTHRCRAMLDALDHLGMEHHRR